MRIARSGWTPRGKSLLIVRKLLAIVLALPLAYAAAALLLGLVPANAGWREAPAGITIFVSSNGVHTGIGVPIVSGEMDWRPLVPAGHLRDPAIPATHIFIGYGHRDFYLNTPSWGQLSLATAADAAFGDGPALLHVEHVIAPAETQEVKAITFSSEEYRRLVAHLLPIFRRDGAGRTLPLPGRGYGPHDMFYEAEGGFNAVYNCNEWTGRALRAAGVRMGLWTPSAQSVMWRLS